MDLWLNWFLEGLNNFNLDIDNERIEKFKKYIDLITFYNQKFNLTGEKTKEDIAIKQFLDSLVPIVYLKKFNNKPIFIDKNLDIGTGAGIPGIPLKIFSYVSEFLLIDSNKKRVDFLNNTIKELSLEKVDILWGRGEEIIKKIDLREKFSQVFSRWVLKIPGIFELTSPFVKVNGRIFLWKGVDEIDLIKESTSFLDELGLEIEDIFKYELPFYKSERVLLILKKFKTTPLKYPRSFKKIKSLSF
ncbi:MAG: 16S rRNA (guanine(527)-N(7))-methyltransferase RsmG [Caldisericia bacterium]